MFKKIDCHCHIYNEAIRRRYFGQTDGYAVVMQFIPRLMAQDDDCIETVKRDARLFLSTCIDIAAPIPPQLSAIEPHIDEYKIVGLKIYLTYQRGKASDEALFPVYEFAAKHRLSVTFHTGLCSLVLPSDNDMEGSCADHVAEVAERFPQVNFILAHMDDPRYENCVRQVATHENLYTDYSGAYEDGTKEAADIGGAIAIFREAIHTMPGMENKILYGTDYCPPLNMAQTKEYEDTTAAIFPPEVWDKIYYKNCLRAFPRLQDYIGKDFD